MITVALIAWALLCVLVLAQPFLIPAPTRVQAAAGRGAGSSKRQGLLEQKRALYREIQDLELDRATGKLSSDDYQLQREHLVDSAAAVLKALDQTAPLPPAPAPAPSQSFTTPPRDPGAPEPETRFCPVCGTRRAREDRFCRHCGRALA